MGCDTDLLFSKLSLLANAIHRLHLSWCNFGAQPMPIQSVACNDIYIQSFA